MPVDESSVREQIWNLEKFRKWSRKNELVFLPQMMEDGENIMGLTSVLYKERKWLLVVTDRKLILLYRKLVDGYEKTLPIAHVISASCEAGLMFAKLVIVTKKDRITFDSVIKGDAIAIRDILSELVEKGQARPQ